VVIDGRRLTKPKWYYAQSRGVYLLQNGRILNVVTRVYQNDSIWEVWSSTGALLKRVRVHRAYRPFAVTGKGDMLVTYSDPDTDEYVVAELSGDFIRQ
jgi:hypothetical protein